jgi:hypothetical protein
MPNTKILLSVVSAEPARNEKYILSTTDTKIVFPSFEPVSCDKIEDEIMNFLGNCFGPLALNRHAPNLGLLGINNHNMQNILDCKNTIHILYGLVTHKLPIYNSVVVWKSFNFLDLSIPNELAIIGETIRLGF